MKHRIRVCGIARAGDCLALIEQINPDTGHRRWAMPGGGMEATDSDIFRAVEREMFEETGLRVRAGQIRYVSEHFADHDQCTMLTLWIDCSPADTDYGPLSLENTMHDDNIGDVRWWPKAEILAHDPDHMGRHLRKDAFWENLDTPAGTVAYLGRTGG